MWFVPAHVLGRSMENPHSNVAKSATLEWGTLERGTLRDLFLGAARQLD